MHRFTKEANLTAGGIARGFRAVGDQAVEVEGEAAALPQSVQRATFDE